MSRSWWLFGALAAILAAIALVIAGLSRAEQRTFALRTPDSISVATLRAGKQACEGPVQSPLPAHALAIFGTPASGRPTVTAHVLVGSQSRPLTSGRIRAVASESSQRVVTLRRALPAHQLLTVCVTASGGTFSLLGAGAQAPGVGSSGVSPGTQFALLLTRRSTFLGSLPLAFSRAALFKPNWVGAWTFRLLLALFACTLPLAGVAVSRALTDPDPDESSRAPDTSS